MHSGSPSSSLPYHEPDITTILLQACFLLLLNTLNYGLDKLLYCGLLGQVFLGVAWGTPGAKWLGQGAETVIAQLGYLGLLLIVYEGWLKYARFKTFPTLMCNRRPLHVHEIS